MTGRVVGLVSLVATFALLVAGGAIAFGLFLIVSSFGASGFGAALGFAVGMVLGIGGVVGLGPGLLLRRAGNVLREAGPDLPATTPWSRRLSNVVIAIAGIAWLSATAVMAFAGRLDTIVLILNAGGALLCVTSTWASRYLPGQALAVGLLLVAVFGSGIAAWETSSTIDDMNRRAAFAAERQRYEDRFAPIHSGPSAGEVKDAVGTVGTWQPITGGTFPERMDDDWPYGAKDGLADLGGRTVRFAVVGQCWVEAGAGELHPVVWLAVARDARHDLRRDELTVPTLPCDGEVHAVTVVPVQLADFFDVASPLTERQEWLTGAAGVSITNLPSGMDGAEHAARWLLFVSPEPTSDVAELRAAVAAVLPVLVLE